MGVQYVFACPDYVNFFSDCADPRLGFFAKEENTKLQFKFKKTTDLRYPNGACFTYRAFCASNVILIVDKSVIPKGKLNASGRNIGKQAIDVDIPEQPINRFTNELSARYALLKLPSNPIVPAALVSGSRDALDKVISYFEKKFMDSRELALWREWDKLHAPVNDNVVEYFTRKDIKLPTSFVTLFLRPGTGPVLDTDPVGGISNGRRQREVSHFLELRLQIVY